MKTRLPRKVQTILPIKKFKAGVSTLAQLKARNKAGQTTISERSSTRCCMDPIPHTTQRIGNFKKHVDKLKKEKKRQNGFCKTQEEMIAVFNYVQNKMVYKRKRADRNSFTREQELNNFLTCSWSKRPQWMWRTKNSEILAQVNSKKESLKLKNHSYKLLE